MKSVVDSDRCPESSRHLNYNNAMGRSNEISSVSGRPQTRGTRLAFLRFLQSRWTAPVFLVPFVLMLVLHQKLGLSDALLAADKPGERPAHAYNLLLGVNMYFSAAAAVLHFLARSHRALPWSIAKLLIATILLLLGCLAL
jgi:hypothetical protein